MIVKITFPVDNVKRFMLSEEEMKYHEFIDKLKSMYPDEFTDDMTLNYFDDSGDEIPITNVYEWDATDYVHDDENDDDEVQVHSYEFHVKLKNDSMNGNKKDSSVEKENNKKRYDNLKESKGKK